MKRCRKCGDVKPLAEYYIHNQMADGRLNHCKDCVRKRVNNRYRRKVKDPQWRDLERRRSREKYHKNKERYMKYKEKFEERLDGVIGKYRRLSIKYPLPKGYERHHWSYNEEHLDDFISLSCSDHAVAHTGITFDNETGFFRDKDGLLLDTKSKHMKCISEIISSRNSEEESKVA